MANTLPLTKGQQRVLDEYNRAIRSGEGSGGPAIAARLNMSKATVRSALLSLRQRSLICARNRGDSRPLEVTAPEGFSRPDLPTGLRSLDEIKGARRREWELRDEAESARTLIPVQINLDGPIAIAHLGDPHVDDPGMNFPVLERHVQVIQQTAGMFGANVGDQSNNWVGRLAHLYSEQTTRGEEAWVLVEWLVTSMNWIYLLAANHDLWSGDSDPVKWMLRQRATISEAWGARIGLRFPNGKLVRINARHDFAGTSMWNLAHGAMKAAMSGWRDHILTCGHKHASAYGIVKDPATGLVSHCIRVAGYKVWDKYGTGELGLPNQNISPAFVTIIDPRWPDDDPRLITTLFDVESAAEYLTWLRARKSV